MPKEGPPAFLPTIYGFKLFSLRGSKYELKYNRRGQPLNMEEVNQALKRKLKASDVMRPRETESSEE